MELTILKVIVAAAIKKIQLQQPSKKVLKATDVFSDIWQYIPSNSEKQEFGKIIYEVIKNNLHCFPDIIEVGKYNNNTAFYKIN